ncbi:MAG TPA: SPOR domain-containing protein [Stellaceae bacterium]|nr:SPOR domain-containing protein [Stellaceae bacterium]
MAMTPRQAAAVFFGTSLFGLLTFSSGLMIGVGIGGDANLPDMARPAGAPLVGKPAAAPAAAQAMAAPAPTTAPAAAVLVPMPQSAPAAAPRTAAPPTVAQAPAAANGSAQAAAAQPTAIEPVAVKDFRVGLPLDVAPASPLRGRLVEAAHAAPRDLIIAPPAAAAAAPQASAGPAAAPPITPAALPAAATMPAAPPFVFSVQVGSFLVKANAERLASELNKRGYAAQVLVAQSPGEPAWYPVVLPPVSDVATVARQAQEFADSEGRNAEVVSWLAAK